MSLGAPVESRTRHLGTVALNPAALTGEGIGQTRKPHPRPALLHVALSWGHWGHWGPAQALGTWRP